MVKAVVLVKVGALAWEEYFETAPQAHGELGNKFHGGRRPSMAPFRRFKRFEVTGTGCTYVGARAKVSFGLETCQMRISSNFGKGRGGGDCVWFGGEGEIGWDDNAACCGWFDGKREWSLLSKWLGKRERERITWRMWF
ncbi:MAG: hypothetical protein ACTS43_02530 [Candidatus Hodgkinia cicadicola]